MLAIRSLVRNNTQQLIKSVVQQRNMSAIPVPARNKVTRAEMIVLSSVMVFGWCVVPAWVLVNLKHYRDKE